jgi:hypothetical protein
MLVIKRGIFNIIPWIILLMTTIGPLSLAWVLELSIYLSKFHLNEEFTSHKTGLTVITILFLIGEVVYAIY